MPAGWAVNGKVATPGLFIIFCTSPPPTPILLASWVLCLSSPGYRSPLNTCSGLISVVKWCVATLWKAFSEMAPPVLLLPPLILLWWHLHLAFTHHHLRLSPSLSFLSLSVSLLYSLSPFKTPFCLLHSISNSRSSRGLWLWLHGHRVIISLASSLSLPLRTLQAV